MSGDGPDSPLPPAPKTRPVGGTEHSWCKAVPSGTGTTVLALLLTESPNLSLIQSALLSLQNDHPLLRSRLRFEPTTNAATPFSFVTPPSPHLSLTQFDLTSTSAILQTPSDDDGVSPFHRILEHEINRNTWNEGDGSDGDMDLFHASLYNLGEARWVLTLRVHTVVCDRAAAAAVLRQLLAAASGESETGGGAGRENWVAEEVSLAIEDMIPSGKANKPFWVRGMDLLGYSLNSFRLANLEFADANSPRSSRVVRLQMDRDHTAKLLAGCNSNGIKLCGTLIAAALLAAHSSKQLQDNQWEKYAVVTLVDCRSILDPPLSIDHPGFYHSAILNSHDICGRETLWELAKRSYKAFANAKNCNKHFSDMGDLNFLMGKAIENPGLTPSSSLRTAFLSVFEDTVIDSSNAIHEEIGLEDYIGCASVHGVGPSIAIFDTIRDGKLDCACVYPSPLHSREQIQKVIDDMKRILAHSCNDEESGDGV